MFITNKTIALTLLSFSFSLAALAQVIGTDPDLDGELPPPRDSILSVRNMSSVNDTVRSRQIIAIKYQGSIPADSLKMLYINGVLVEGTKAWKMNIQENMIYFAIDQAIQATVLQFAKGEDTDNPYMPVYFGLGTASSQIIAASSFVYVEVHQKISKIWFYAAGIMILFLIALALKCQVLKDDNNLYYSLGRAQLFFWTLLFMLAYLYICFQTDSPPDIPTSVLVIIGISVATTGASRAIESNAKNNIPIDPNAKSQGFLIDILSDGASINIQRFQNVVFNVLFGLLFLQKTISSHLLPDFDQNVLILLGVSSGAYAGLKATEQAKEQTDVAGPTVADEIAPAVTPPTPPAPAEDQASSPS